MAGKLEVHGPNLTPDQTRRLVRNVNQSAESLGYSLAVLFNRRGWLALGYVDWASFSALEFRPARDSLSRAARQMAVLEAADGGMSGNAIAAALGISAMTVSRDLTDAGVERRAVIDEHGVEQDIAGRGLGSRNRGSRKKASSDRSVPQFPLRALRTILGRVGTTLDSATVETLRHVIRDELRLLEQYEAAVGLAELESLTGSTDTDEDDDE